MELPQRPRGLPAIALAPPQAVEDGDQIIDNGRSVSLWLANARVSVLIKRFLGSKCDLPLELAAFGFTHSLRS